MYIEIKLKKQPNNTIFLIFQIKNNIKKYYEIFRV